MVNEKKIKIQNRHKTQNHRTQPATVTDRNYDTDLTHSHHLHTQVHPHSLHHHHHHHHHHHPITLASMLAHSCRRLLSQDIELIQGERWMLEELARVCL
jgi:hypothetical protein